MADNEKGNSYVRDKRRAEGRGEKKNTKQGQEEEEKDAGEMSTTDKKREREETGNRRVKRRNARGRVFICMSHRGKGMGGCD